MASLNVQSINGTTLFALLPRMPPFFHLSISVLNGRTKLSNNGCCVPPAPVDSGIESLETSYCQFPGSREEWTECVLDIMKALPTLVKVGVPGGQLYLLPQMLVRHPDVYPHLKTIRVAAYNHFGMLKELKNKL